MKGQELYRFVHEMRQLHVQVAGLLATVDGLLEDRGWAKAYGNTANAYASASLENPRQWMPCEHFRFYKLPKYPRALGFVGVVLLEMPDADLKMDEPAITAGWFEYPSAAPAISAENQWLVRWPLYASRSPALDGKIREHVVAELAREEVDRWQYPFTRARTFALPLVAMDSATTLESQVIAPLVDDARDIGF